MRGSGALVVEILQAAELFGIGNLVWNSADYIDRLGRIFTLVFGDRAQYMGDPRFMDVPIDLLVSPERAAEIVDKVKSDADLREPSWQRSAGQDDPRIGDGCRRQCCRHDPYPGNFSGVVTAGLGFLYNNDMHAFDPLREAELDRAGQARRQWRRADDPAA